MIIKKFVIQNVVLANYIIAKSVNVASVFKNCLNHIKIFRCILVFGIYFTNHYVFRKYKYLFDHIVKYINMVVIKNRIAQKGKPVEIMCLFLLIMLYLGALI